MALNLTVGKIKERHKRLLAYLYIRQSTGNQVLSNTGSTEVQRSMFEVALAYGFCRENIKVVERDQGRSGARLQGRDGFKEMLIDIAHGRVGAVICYHSSRLARSGKDMNLLVQLGEVTGTLIIDKNSTFDPQNENDRFFLGMKGVVDEAERARIKAQLFDAKLALAKKGELRMMLPVGYARLPNDKVVMSPEKDVREAVKGVFSSFERLGSARAVVVEMNADGRLFPRIFLSGDRKGEYDWRPITCSRVRSILHNPTYAGAYVFGKSKTSPKITFEDLPEVSSSRGKAAPEEWLVFIPDAHEGYISHEKFLQNCKQLSDNAEKNRGSGPGAPREGRGVLQGLIYCGICERKMRVTYPRGRKGSPVYLCNYEQKNVGGKLCQGMGGATPDALATDLLLGSITPSQLELSIEAAKQDEARSREGTAQQQRRVQQAHAELEEARNRYLQVDPRNRLVAQDLEDAYEKKAAELQRAQSEYEAAKLSAARPLDDSQKEAIISLAKDIPRIWRSEKMTNVTRKLILRTLIEKVYVWKEGLTLRAKVCWQTKAETEVRVPLLTVADQNRTDLKALELVRKWAPDLHDDEIAARLNKMGLTSRHGRPFTAIRVSYLRRKTCGVNLFFDRTGRVAADQDIEGRYSSEEAAVMLNVTSSAISIWCRQGKVDGIRAGNGRVKWWVKLNPEIVSKLRKPVKAFRQRKDASPKASP